MATPTYELITTQTLTVDSAQIQLTDIPQTYSQIILVVRNSYLSSGYGWLNLYFNNDLLVENYIYLNQTSYISATGTDTYASYDLWASYNDEDFWNYIELTWYSSGVPEKATHVKLNIFDYANPDKYTVATYSNYTVYEPDEHELIAGTATYCTIDAITSITITPDSDSDLLNAGSEYSLYGIK